MSSETPSLVPALARAVFRPVFAIAVAVVIGAVLVALMGDDPVEVYATLLSGALVGWPNLAVTLQQTSPLIFTGLAVSIAFRAGVWNIGVEGQMLIGAMAAGIVGYALDVPAWLHVPLCMLAAAVAGAVWAAIPGVLRAYLGVNEIVICLMLNPIALLFTGWLASRVLKAPGPTNKLPDILETAELDRLTLFSQLNTGIFLALALVVVLAFVNFRTPRGLEWKWVGLNPRFAFYGGVDVPRQIVLVMLVSGAVAGLGGAEQVQGVYRAFYDDFSPGYGFDGIAVGMLANFNPLFVVLSAGLLGTLASGSTVLQMMTGVSKHLVQVLQFTMVLMLAAKFGFDWRGQRRRTVSDEAVEPGPVTTTRAER